MHATKTKFLFALLLVAFAANAFGQQRHINGTPRFVVRPGGNVAAAVNESALASNIPLWSSSFVSGGTTYNFTMVCAGFCVTGESNVW